MVCSVELGVLRMNRRKNWRAKLIREPKVSFSSWVLRDSEFPVWITKTFCLTFGYQREAWTWLNGEWNFALVAKTEAEMEALSHLAMAKDSWDTDGGLINYKSKVARDGSCICDGFDVFSSFNFSRIQLTPNFYRAFNVTSRGQLESHSACTHLSHFLPR